MDRVNRRALVLLLALATTPAADAGDGPFTAAGVVRASERLELRTDLQAAVSEVRRREGEAFEKGDTLIAFDCTRHRADHAAANARARAAEEEARQAAHLHSLGAAGTGELRVARARAEAARADAEAGAARITDCTIAAPFAGRVTDVSARANSVPDRGTPLMELVGRAAPEIDMVVPSEWLRWLRIGTALRFEVRETGATLPARVDRLGAEVDPVSRTIAVRAVPETEVGDLLAGMSGLATFEANE